MPHSHSLKGIYKFYITLAITLIINQLLAQEQPATTQSEDSLKVIPEKKLQAKEYFLSLEKSGGHKRIRFFVGDDFYYKLKGEKILRHSVISGIQKDGIVLEGTLIAVSEIRKVRLYNPSHLIWQAANYIPKAGLLFLAFDMINPIIQGQEKVKVRKPTLVISGTMITTGLLFNLFKRRTIRLNNQRYLRTLEDY